MSERGSWINRIIVRERLERTHIQTLVRPCQYRVLVKHRRNIVDQPHCVGATPRMLVTRHLQFANVHMPSHSTIQRGANLWWCVTFFGGV